MEGRTCIKPQPAGVKRGQHVEIDVLAGQVDGLAHADRVVEEVAVGHLRALGPAGGARRVEDAPGVVVTQPRRGHAVAIAGGQRVDVGCRISVGRIAQDQLMLNRYRSSQIAHDLSEFRLVDQQPWPAVVEDVLQFRHSQSPIERIQDQARFAARHQHHVVIGAVAGQNRHAVALA